MNIAMKGLEDYKLKLPPPSIIKPIITDDKINNKISAYKIQDKRAKRSIENYITCDNIKELLKKYNYIEFVTIQRVTIEKLDYITICFI